MQSSFQIGEANISVITVGHFLTPLKDVVELPETESQKLKDFFENPILLPSNVICIKLGTATIIVDPNDYLASCPPGSKEFPTNYSVPPNLVAQLEQDHATRREKVTHVVITHTHYDHYAAVTFRDKGEFQPTFLAAKYFLGKLDWDDKRILEPQKTREIEQSLDIIHNRKMLLLLTSLTEISPGVTVIPSPGETRGHIIVKVASKGQMAYCTGDLFHHAIEVQHPKLMPKWASIDSNLDSRKFLLQNASRENAIILPAHMSPGRLEKNSSSSDFIWKEV